MFRPVVPLLSLLIIQALLMPVAVLAAPGDVRYLGSYWGQGGVREDAAPGDSGARLTVALGNELEEDSISNIVGVLRLPAQLRSQNKDDPGSAESHHLGVVPPGGSFELTFIVDVDPTASVRVDYHAYLELSYRVVGGSRVLQFIPVNVNIPGRPLLKLAANTTSIKPGVINSVELTLRNEGTGPASDVRISILQQPSSPYGVILKEQPWIVGKLGPNDSVKTVLGVYAPSNVGDSLAALSASISYRNTIGQRAEYSAALSFYVERPAIELIDVRVLAPEIRVEPGGTTETILIFENIGSSTAYDVVAELAQTAAPTSFFGSTTWRIGALNPGERRTVTTVVAAAQQAANGVYQIPLLVLYKDLVGNKKSSTSTITVQVGDIPPKAPNLLLASRSSMLAGTPQKVIVTLENIYGSEIRKVSVTAVSRTLGVTILGSNSWLFDRITPGQTAEIELELYASPEVAGSSATIYFTSTYILGDKEERVSEDREIGYIVEGYISLTLYDLRIITIGNDFFLTGNILNEGISDALFSSISLIGPKGREGALFLGEIKPNAPLPFNLKINTEESLFKGKLVVTYKDVYRRELEDEFDFALNVPPRVSELGNGQSQPLQAPAVALIAAAVAIPLVLVLVWGARRRAASRHS